MLFELSHVSKRYGDVEALRQVDLALEPSSIGLLGPNGAGKSTLLKLLLGLIQPESGSVTVLGKRLPAEATVVRAHIGYMPEGDAVIGDLTAYEYTALSAELCGIPRAEAKVRAHQVLHYVGLGEVRYRKTGSYSTGMRQRVRLAQALVGDPKLLLLDEPTSGLDPQGREDMLTLINDIPHRTGASVVLSTHILPDVERTCSQVVVLSSGQVLYAGPIAPLLASEQTTYDLRGKGNLDKLAASYNSRGWTTAVRGGNLEIQTAPGVQAGELLRLASENAYQVRHLAPLRQTLERAFFRTLKEAGHAD
ncbi:MAG: ABC transporter ATP-binding protein [Myxococcales bacterium]|nr:ABC transporter ATP-binding protein [Myxococcales bacterium]MCB9709217.1 ABC transporter ATP-binding protein [Myxococcales bacterium]